MTSYRRVAILTLLLVCAYLLVGYTAVVVAYYKTRNQMVDSIMARIPNDGQGTSVFDVNTGYRYRANMEVGPRSTPSPIHYRTNGHGLIAREDFPFQKPAGEFRIGFVGDSSTAGVTTTIRWTDVVEDELNTSEKWRHFVGERHTRCINFGLDGIGTIQFGPVVEDMVKPFNVDILVVNMLREDVIRRPYHRGFQTTVSRQQVTQYADSLVSQLPRFEISPEVMAKTIGRHFGMTPRPTYAAIGKDFWGTRLYDDPIEAADVSAASINQILHYFPHAIFLVDPTYREYTGPKDPLVIQAFDALTKKIPDIHWIIMTDQLPQPTNKTEFDSWFNVPSDEHRNASGAKIYGDTVAHYLIEHLPGNSAEMK